MTIKAKILLLATLSVWLALPVAYAQDPPVDQPDVVAPTPEPTAPDVVAPVLPEAPAPVAPAPEVTPPVTPPVVPAAEVAPVVEEVVPPPIPVVGEPVDVGGAIQDIPEILSAFKGGQYLVGVALILLVLISILKMFWAKLPPKAARWVAVGTGFVGGAASAWAAGVPWYSGLLAGLTVGLAAIGSYEVLKGAGVVKKVS